MRAFTLVTLACLFWGCTETSQAPRPRERGQQPEPLRRLSHVEYRNTLADLFPNVPAGEVSVPELPPDLSTGGLENNAEALGPSDLLLRRYDLTARAYAAAATTSERIGEIVPCESWATPTQAEECAHAFITTFGRRALRAPVSADTEARLAARMRGWTSRVDFPAAVELAIVAMLAMPQFAYRLEVVPAEEREGSRLSDFELASRLSYALWQSMPDDALLDAAASGELSTDAGLDAQVARMLASPRTTRNIADFHRQWLDVGRILNPEHASRANHPAWNPETQRDAHEELLRFLTISAAQPNTLEALWTSREASVSGRLAPFYGLPASDPETWTSVTLPEERAGVLTRIATLASHAHTGYPVPPLRGNYVLSRILCAPLGAPPAGADLSEPTPPAGEVETNRQSFARRVAGPACASCHQSMDGIGFVFESFDESGMHRVSDSGLPVDTSGVLIGTDVDGPIVDAVDLSRRFATSRSVERCYVRRWSEFVRGRTLRGSELAELDDWVEVLHASGGDTRALLSGLVHTPAFRHRSSEGQ